MRWAPLGIRSASGKGLVRLAVMLVWVWNVPSPAPARIVELGPAVQVNGEPVGNRGDPQIVALPEGGFVVFWDGRVGAGERPPALARSFDAAGAPIGSVFEVTGVPAPASFAPIPGGFVAVSDWYDPPVLRSFTVGGALQDSRPVPPGRTTCCFATLAASPQGNLLFAWKYFYDLYGQSLTAELGPLGQSFQVRGVDDRFHLTLDSHGRTLIASWYESEAEVWAQRVTAQGQTSDTFLVADGVGMGGTPSICADQSGDFVVSWSGNRRFREFRRYNALAQPTTGRLALGLRSNGLACLSEGRFVAVGGELVHSLGDSIVLRTFDAGTRPIGQLLIPVPYFSKSPAVVALSEASQLAVAWRTCTVDVVEECDVLVQRFAVLPGKDLPGDCDGNGVVTIDEVIAAVRFALFPGDEPCRRIGFCLLADINLDCEISVDEIITAVASLLESGG